MGKPRAAPGQEIVSGILIPLLDAERNPDAGERVDKWLWAVRVFRTRALATEACRAGSIEISGVLAKPARAVRLQDQIAVRQGIITRTFRVLGFPPSRVGAKRVPEFYQDLTPETEFAKLREQRVQQLLARDKGAGRPTKRDRREQDRFFG